MAGFWGRRKREQAETAQQDADLARRAQSSLVAADEHIRLAVDEVSFAEAELGPNAVGDLRAALDSVRTHMQEAFHLQQLNHDEIPDTADELRTRNSRIIQLCDWAEDLLEDRMAALAEPIERARRAPEIIARVRADVARIRARLPHARDTVERLATRYSTRALEGVGANPAEAEQLLNFAEAGAGGGVRRREGGRGGQAWRARVAGRLAARSAPQVPAVIEARSALPAALSALPAAGVNTDPFEHLTRMREANAALDAAVAAALERASRPIPELGHVRNAIDDADRQLAVARDVIAGHRGWIGADARTRLAEAERVRADLDRVVGGSAATVPTIPEDDREQALEFARRSAQLAGDALRYAQRDIDASRPAAGPPPQWGGPMEGFGRRAGGGSDLVGGILGGLVIGSILDGIFD